MCRCSNGLRREYAEGCDRVLRGATAVLFIHAPRESRFGAEDGNLAYENASLMAEALGVSQIYMGFVLTAVRQDRKAKLAAMLGLGDRRICAVMALGMRSSAIPIHRPRAGAGDAEMRAGLNFSPQYFQGLRRCLPGLNEVDMRSMRSSRPPGGNRPSRRDVSARGLPPPLPA